MDKKLREKQLESLADSPHGEALRDYINEKITELSDITKVESWEDTKGRQWAIKKLSEIFKKIQKKEPLPERRREFE